MADKCFHGVPHDQHCVFCDIIQHQAVRHPDPHLRRIAQKRFGQLRRMRAFNLRVYKGGVRGVEDAKPAN